MIPQQLIKNEPYVYRNGMLYLTLLFIDIYIHHPHYDVAYKFAITDNLIDTRDSDIGTGIFLTENNVRQYLEIIEVDEYINNIEDIW